MELKHRSRVITDGRDRAAARSMYKAIGFTSEDLAKPLIGVANTWIETMPCNFHLRRLSAKVKEGVRAAGGTIAAGNFRGKDVTIQDVFEAIGANAAGKMSDSDLHELETVACPGAGACGGQYTANTMSTVMEMIGISPMGYNSVPAMDPQKDTVAMHCGELVMNLLKKGTTAKQILV